MRQWTEAEILALARGPRQQAIAGAIEAFQLEDRAAQAAALAVVRGLDPLPDAELAEALRARPLAALPFVGALGSEALVADVVQLCASAQPDVRALAVLTLGRMPLGDAEKERMLAAALADPEPAVRANAAVGLGRLGSAGALAAVREAFAREQNKTVRVFLVDVLDAHGALP